jgi:two-component system, chemotaxis family, chemotaxis protein CheY
MLLKLAFRHARVDMFEAENGDEALDIAARHTPDIVICDGTMPFSHGGEVGRVLREMVPGALMISFSGSDRNKAWADISVIKGTPGDLEAVRIAVEERLASSH